MEDLFIVFYFQSILIKCIDKISEFFLKSYHLDSWKILLEIPKLYTFTTGEVYNLLHKYNIIHVDRNWII